jgi:hypothetical protein
MVDPLENLPMPHKTILSIEHPMIFVWEVQELARHAPRLQDIEEHDTFGLGETIVEGVVDYELRGGPVENVVDRIPALIILTVVPKSAIELFKVLAYAFGSTGLGRYSRRAA